MSKVIGILNYKGGVAKTTTALNLGTALWVMGYKVLMVDADMQRNLTVAMDWQPENPDDATFETWLRGKTADLPIYVRYDGLDYIPAGANMDELEIFLITQKFSEDFLRERLNSPAIQNEYDYILIDCPPHRGTINDNALAASTGVIIPTDESCLSVQGMQYLSNDIQQFQKRTNPKLEVIGALKTKFNKRTKAAKVVTQLLEQVFPGKTLGVVIRPYTGVNLSPMSHQSLFEYDPESTAADDYMRLAEIVSGKKRPRNWKDKALKAYEKNMK